MNSNYVEAPEVVASSARYVRPGELDLMAQLAGLRLREASMSRSGKSQPNSSSPESGLPMHSLIRAPHETDNPRSYPNRADPVATFSSDAKNRLAISFTYGLGRHIVVLVVRK